MSVPELSEGRVLLACRGKDPSHIGKQVLPAASISALNIISLVMTVKVGQIGLSWNIPTPIPSSK